MRRLPLLAVSALAATLAVVPAVTGGSAPSLRGAVPVSATAAQAADGHGAAPEPGDDRAVTPAAPVDLGDGSASPAASTAVGAAPSPAAQRAGEPGDDRGGSRSRTAEVGDDRGGSRSRSAVAGDDRGGSRSRSAKVGDDRGRHGGGSDDHGGRRSR